MDSLQSLQALARSRLRDVGAASPSTRILGTAIAIAVTAMQDSDQHTDESDDVLARMLAEACIDLSLHHQHLDGSSAEDWLVRCIDAALHSSTL